ncbi:MAG: translocation/assembly module TamB domain-containing protein [Usitatibacter sp.]
MSAPETAPTPKPPRRRRWLRWFAYAVLALLALGCAGILWLVGTQGGAEFAFGKIQQLIGTATNIEGVEGSIGGNLKIRRFEVVHPGFVVRIEGLEADISPFYAGHLTIHRLHAKSVEVRTSPSAQSNPSMKAPPDFSPPFPVRLEDGAIGTLTYGAIASHDNDLVFSDIVVRGEGEGTRWRVAEGATGTEWGKVKLKGFVAGASPFDLDVAAEFAGVLQKEAINAAATARGTLKSIEVKAEAAMAGARAAASTNVRPFEPVMLGSIDLDASAVDLSRFVASMPSTRISIQAKLAPRGDTLAGRLHVANAETGPWDHHRLPLVSASAELAASPHGADFTAIEVALPAGSVRGQVHVAASGAQAQLQLTDVDLATLHGKLRKTQLGGKLAITGDRGAQRFEADVDDPRFALAARALLTGERLEVESASVRAGGGTLSARGALALGGRREFHAEGEAKNFDPSVFAAAPRGDINFTFSTTGTLADAPAGEVKIDMKPSVYAGLAASGRVHIAGDARRISSADVDVSLAEARLTARGNLGRAGDAMDVSLHAPDLAKVTRPLGKTTVAGSLDARVKLAGTFDEGSVNATVNGTNLQLPGELRISAAKVTLDGTREAHRLEATVKRDSAVTVHVAVQGGVAQKAGTIGWNGRVDAFSVTGPGAFALAAPATLTLSRDSAELGDARLRGEWGEAHLEVTRWAKGAFDFKGSAPSVEINRLAKSLGLEAPPRSDLVFSASWNLRAAQSIDGNVVVKRESGDIHVGDPELSMGLSDATLAIEVAHGRVHGTLNIAGSRVGSIRGEAHGEIASAGNGWEFAKSAPVDARVTAAIPNLDVLAPWVGPDTKLGGRLDADLTVSGTGADPHMEAKARAQDITMREPRSGFEIAHGSASAHVDGKTLVIDELSARTPWRVPDRAKEYLRVGAPDGGGSIDASGSVDFGSHVGSIRVKIDKVPVMQLPTRFVAASGEAKLEADGKGASVVGTFKADAGWIGALAEAPPSPSDDIVVVRAEARPEETKSKEPIRIDVTASLGDGIAFQGRGLDTHLVGEMRVVGEIGAPLRATGSIRTSEGTYEGYGQKLTIDRGVLTFAGPIDNPKLNVLATRKGLAVEPGVEVTGTIARPRVRLVSTPDVPESEKLSWLVLGRSAAGASPADVGVLTAAAGALMGEKRPGADLQKKLGIDEVSIGHSDSGSPLGVMPQSTVAGRTGSPAATDVVTIGSQITKQVRMSYEQGFADAEGALKVTWNITKQFQLLARAGYLPGLDIVYRWTLK